MGELEKESDHPTSAFWSCNDGKSVEVPRNVEGTHFAPSNHLERGSCDFCSCFKLCLWFHKKRLSQEGRKETEGGKYPGWYISEMNMWLGSHLVHQNCVTGMLSHPISLASLSDFLFSCKDHKKLGAKEILSFLVSVISQALIPPSFCSQAQITSLHVSLWVCCPQAWNYMPLRFYPGPRGDSSLKDHQVAIKPQEKPVDVENQGWRPAVTH